MAEEFKVLLGAELKNDALQGVQNQLSNIQTEPIKLKLDTDSAKSKLKTIKKQIEGLNDVKIALNTGGTNSKSGNKNILPISTSDVTKLTQSLDKLDSSLDSIRNALGALDDASGMQSILATINQINSSLSEMGKQFKTVEQMFNGASFNLNFNLGGGKNPVANNALYSETVRNEIIPQLRRQAEQLAEVVNQTYGQADKYAGAMSLLLQTQSQLSGKIDVIDLFGRINDSDASLNKQMGALRQFVNVLQEAADIRRIDLSGVTSGFDKTADEYVRDAQKILSGENQMEESMQKIKSIVGSANNINFEGVSTQLDSIVRKLDELNQTVQQFSVNISFDGLTDSFRELTDSIQNLVNSCTTVRTCLTNGFDGAEAPIEGAARQTREVVDAFNELMRVQTRINSIGLEINRLDTTDDAQRIVTLTNELTELQDRADELFATFGDQFSPAQMDRFNNAVEVTNSKIDALRARYQDAQNALAQEIRVGIQNGDLDRDLSNVTTALSKIETQSTECQTAVQEFNVALTNLRTAYNSGDTDAIIRAHEAYEDALQRVNNQLAINANNQRQASAAQRQAQAAAKLAIKNTALSSEMDVWLKKNTAAAKQFESQIIELKRQLATCDDAFEHERISAAFKEIKRQAELAGQSGLSFADKLKEKFSEFSAYFSVASMFSYVQQALRSMYDNVVEVDTAMTNLYKVTDETSSKYEQFMTSASKSSQELGRSLSSFIEQTANWAKMGFDVDESEELAKLSSIYANVAEVDDDTAVSDLVTAIKAYGIEASNAITIVDSLNKISNEFAVTAAGLGQGLSKSASTMATAGTDMEHTLALLTGISEITQSPDEAGNFLKTAIARIQGKPLCPSVVKTIVHIPCKIICGITTI